MDTLAKICDALQCDITDVIELVDGAPEESKEDKVFNQRQTAKRCVDR